MSKSRSVSTTASTYNRRKRSNTVLSIPVSPLAVGDSKDFILWVHDPASPNLPPSAAAAPAGLPPSSASTSASAASAATAASTSGGGSAAVPSSASSSTSALNSSGGGNAGNNATAVSDVIFNREYWPGVAEGDMIRVTAVTGDEDVDGWREKDGFLFVVRKAGEEFRHSIALQVSVSKCIADAFGLRNHMTVRLTKVDSSKMRAQFIEIIFQDQYLGRSDMWRIGKQLRGQCVHVGQEVFFAGHPAGKIQKIHIDGNNVSSAVVTALTKTIFRSSSAKVTIFIQVCRELWEFAGDGERYTEKIVHSFLPALFRRWREAESNHIVTIVLISRVFYLESEIDYAAGPLRQDDYGRWYKDFYKVITDLEVVQDWKPTLVSLKGSFFAFQRDILLTHHYHRAALGAKDGQVIINPSEVKLVGRISYAHEGPILEAINLALNPMESHYIDRSLSITGAAFILITPGTGYYQVSKRLLRMTTTRLLDQGIGMDLASLAKRPLHQSPIFSFRGYEPEVRPETSRGSWRSNDPLWGGDDDLHNIPGKERTTFWWEPYWMQISFWDAQMDLPFRQDRFVARARMHQIEMLGLLEHDVLASINVPYLPVSSDSMKTPVDENPVDIYELHRQEAERLDLERFALHKTPPLHLARDSAPSSGTTIIVDSTNIRPQSFDRRPSHILQRSSSHLPRIAPIEESPQKISKELPPEGDEYSAYDRPTLPIFSPSSSIKSDKSDKSDATTKAEDRRPQEGSSNKMSLGSWLLNPFRVARASSISTAEVSPASVVTTTSMAQRTPSPSRYAASPAVSMPTTRPPRPVTICRRAAAGFSSATDDEISTSARSSTFVRHSPLMNASPRSKEDTMFISRRSAMPYNASSMAMSSRTNPLRPNASISYAQSSLASRWRHMFPHPLYKHQIKWKSMVTPGCLPLTTEYFPSRSELETSYDVFSYEFITDPPEMKSFLVKPPTISKDNTEEARRAWALFVMRGMAALRLVQGFQFVVRPRVIEKDGRKKDRNSKYYAVEDELTPKPVGSSEIFQTSIEPVYLSMSNEIHRISYNGEAIQVRRYVRRMPPMPHFQYSCLVWPKLGVGYTELSTSFNANALENYNWNRLDMLIAGYEHQFSDSLRYWRTRFLVIPTLDAPQPVYGASGERLNDEETRLMGSDKLAEMWSKLRWLPPAERERGGSRDGLPPVRFLPTYLGPTACVLDEHLVSRLEEAMETGPLGKKMRSEREIADMNLVAIAKLMREDRTGLAIKDQKWHTAVYEDAFTGYDFASWLCREFRDVSTREQAQEWGAKLMEQGLFEHCRGKHGFLDGHYFYRLTSEYAIPRTPRSSRGWGFRSVARHVSGEDKETRVPGFYPSCASVRNNPPSRRSHKRLALSQTMTTDVDPNKKSDQAECVILHYDLIHNPANVLHFELHWLGTTARLTEEQLRTWSARIERYGLKLVEAYVGQIADVQKHNPFQSCFPVHLALAPPHVADLARRLQVTGADGSSLVIATPPQFYFEYALLRRFGFILDIEAHDLYPASVEVFYSYRREAFTHSQFVHRTGVAFVQVLGGTDGFLFLTNRLMRGGRGGAGAGAGAGVGAATTTMTTTTTGGSAGLRNGALLQPAATADELRSQLYEFCQDTKKLSAFYDEVIVHLPQGPEEPPPLSI